jgi:hypothetical protein
VVGPSGSEVLVDEPASVVLVEPGADVFGESSGTVVFGESSGTDVLVDVEADDPPTVAMAAPVTSISPTTRAPIVMVRLPMCFLSLDSVSTECDTVG